MEGLILKGIGSFYTVLCGGREYVCKARGRFRKEHISPFPGDRVSFEPAEKDGEGYLLEILPRRNLLLRPSVANVDQLLVVLSASRPLPDLMLVDKLLVQCETARISPVLLVNKCDEQDAALLAEFVEQYRPTGYPIFCVSALSGEGIEALKPCLAGKTSCFAGQSAVGKSSILNAILPQLELETGGLSHKTERGRHTTRHAELYAAFGGQIVDTPGFSLLELSAMEPEQLAGYYPEMRGASGCRFPGCLHLSEPGCAVKPKLARGELSKERYARYGQFIEELKEARKHRYD